MAPPTTFDHEYPHTEQIPRIMRVNITSQNGRALTTINGETLGDPLTDNHPWDDGYRYHDVFHIAHATLLGWSPTLRGLLRKKRRSSPRVHHIEDGRHAIMIEEGLTALVFSYAERHSFLEGINTLDYELLRTIKTMTAHLEVSVRTEYQWEQTILQGYAVWRTIRDRRSGRLVSDLNARTLTMPINQDIKPHTK